MIRYDRDGFHHAEIFRVPDSGQTIFVRCQCPRQDDHDYERPETLESPGDATHEPADAAAHGSADDASPGSPGRATRRSPTGRSAGRDE